MEDPVYRSVNNDHHILRVNEYQGIVGVRVGRKSKWDATLFAVLSRPTFEAAPIKA